MDYLYVYDSDHVLVQETDPAVWATFMGLSSHRDMAHTYISNGVEVKTVFTGIDLSFGTWPLPIPFQTVAFRTGLERDGLAQGRASTWDDAMTNHTLFVDNTMSAIYTGDPGAVIEPP